MVIVKLVEAIDAFREYVSAETLALALSAEKVEEADIAKSMKVNGEPVELRLKRAAGRGRAAAGQAQTAEVRE